MIPAHWLPRARRCALPLACVALLALAACGDDEKPAVVDATGPDTPVDIGDDEPDGDPIPPIPSELLPASELTHGLFGWPERDFGRGNAATIHIDLREGDAATDFTLRDTSGEAHTLADLLAERPVLLILGSFT